MRAFLGVVGGLFVLAFLFLSAGAAWTAWRFHASQPTYEGELSLEGLSAPVTVQFDAHGVPHIFGESEADIFFALGYIHAQERFFQMDMIRRFVFGRLSEVVGEATLRSDARSILRGFPEVAEAALANMTPNVRAGVDAYTAGVNARLAQGAPSPEYALFWFAPEPWRPVDSTAVTIYMAEDLASGLGEEYDRARLIDVLPPAMREAFIGGYPADGPTTLKAEDVVPAPAPEPAAPANDPGGVANDPVPGSNAWVVSGARSATGKPLLANDPHLGIGWPSVWYFARLALPDGDVLGATVPGAPLVILGRNEHVAWGFTNTGFDVMDIIRRPAGQTPTTPRTVMIPVRFGDDVAVTVRETELGPILDPAYFNLLGEVDGTDTILRSTVLDRSNDVAGASYRIMKAKSFDAFVEAGRGWTAPMQNMHVADVEGTIGYTTAGLLPIRDAAGNWTGYVPYDELPRVKNPIGGVIASGNNRIVPDGYPYPAPGDYTLHRALRIEAVLAAKAVHTVDDFAALQMDVTSVQAQRLLPVLRAGDIGTEAGRAALALLEGWDGTMAADAVAPTIYAAWLRELPEVLFKDELDEMFPRMARSRPIFLETALLGEDPVWCDDVTTEQTETCATTVGFAFDKAIDRLIQRLGPDMTLWTWGDQHPALFDHPLLSAVPGLGGMFTHETPMGGDGATVNVAHFPSDPERGFEAGHAASLRAIYDLADLDRSKFVHAPGQSGHPLSPHARDLADVWGAGDYIEIPTSIAPDTPGLRRLTLSP